MNKIIYQLTTEDVQEVAQKEVGRKLSNYEIKILCDRIADRIPWYEAIAESIDELVINPN